MTKHSYFLMPALLQVPVPTTGPVQEVYFLKGAARVHTAMALMVWLSREGHADFES